MVSVSRDSEVEAIVESRLFDSGAAALAYSAALDPFAVILKDKFITAKILSNEPKKTK